MIKKGEKQGVDSVEDIFIKPKGQDCMNTRMHV
jgi:hypothetical protein